MHKCARTPHTQSTRSSRPRGRATHPLTRAALDSLSLIYHPRADEPIMCPTCKVIPGSDPPEWECGVDCPYAHNAVEVAQHPIHLVAKLKARHASHKTSYDQAATEVQFSSYLDKPITVLKQGELVNLAHIVMDDSGFVQNVSRPRLAPFYFSLAHPR